MRATISGIGTLAPGWASWGEARARLAGGVACDPSALPKPVPELLAPAERRRASEAVRWTQAPALEALSQAGVPPNDSAAVFASSSGNPEIVHQICEALARPERDVSPTRFHNSVHNAAAGYWAIGTGCRETSTSIACFDGSFAAGLLEAVTQVTTQARPVVLVAYDVPYPEPLYGVRAIASPFTIALLLQGAAEEKGIATMRLRLTTEPPAGEALADTALESLRLSNPAARALPLLRAIAREESASFVLEYLPQCSLAIELAPC